MKNLKKLSILGAVAVSAIVLSACSSYKQSFSTNKATTTTPSQSASSSSDVDEADAAIVTFTDSGFAPATLAAKVGQKVVFKNDSSSSISVNSAPHPTHNLYPELNIGMIAAGVTGSTSFVKAGTYKYHNHLNASQTGTIVVQ